MRKLRKKTAALLKDRKGNMMPLVVAVTICMLIIILGVAEYMRLVITAAGIKDAMESAVISTVNDNYNEVYHSVREGIVFSLGGLWVYLQQNVFFTRTGRGRGGICSNQ